MVGLTREQRYDRERSDQRQIAMYAQAMMEREFPSLGFQHEEWKRSNIDGRITYRARWPDGSAIQISQVASPDPLWDIAFVDREDLHYTTGEIVKREKNLDLLSVRCIAFEWTKHFNVNSEATNGD